MAYDSNVLRRATARLEENKRRREDQREQLRQQLYAREPRLAKLDRQLQGTMAQLVAASLRKGEDAGAAVRAIRDLTVTRLGRACRVEFTAVLHNGETVEVTTDV